MTSAPAGFASSPHAQACDSEKHLHLSRRRSVAVDELLGDGVDVRLGHRRSDTAVGLES